MNATERQSSVLSLWRDATTQSEANSTALHGIYGLIFEVDDALIAVARNHPAAAEDIAKIRLKLDLSFREVEI